MANEHDFERFIGIAGDASLTRGWPTLSFFESVEPGAPFVRSMRGDFLYSLFHFLVRVDAVGGDFDFGNATEGEQKLYEVFGWLFRSLFHNVANGVGDRGLEHHALGLQAG